MAERHIGIPRVFSSGDVTEWLQRYEIIMLQSKFTDRASESSDATYPFRRRALAVWIDMSETDQANYATVKVICSRS